MREGTYSYLAGRCPSCTQVHLLRILERFEILIETPQRLLDEAVRQIRTPSKLGARVSRSIRVSDTKDLCTRYPLV